MKLYIEDAIDTVKRLTQDILPIPKAQAGKASDLADEYFTIREIVASKRQLADLTDQKTLDQTLKRGASRTLACHASGKKPKLSGSQQRFDQNAGQSASG
jgi:hypothetical protein